jgi:hypothetical protein
MTKIMVIGGVAVVVVTILGIVIVKRYINLKRISELLSERGLARLFASKSQAVLPSLRPGGGPATEQQVIDAWLQKRCEAGLPDV